MTNIHTAISRKFWTCNCNFQFIHPVSRKQCSHCKGTPKPKGSLFPGQVRYAFRSDTQDPRQIQFDIGDEVEVYRPGWSDARRGTITGILPSIASVIRFYAEIQIDGGYPEMVEAQEITALKIGDEWVRL